LLIQKEFSSFSDTHERLDLLALDKQGSLVIIENKLDDTGRDVTWQALKYASYCSGLSKEHIRKIYQEYLDRTEPASKAEEKLSEFFEGAYTREDLATDYYRESGLVLWPTADAQVTGANLRLLTGSKRPISAT
jgi:hypothetical protein